MAKQWTVIQTKPAAEAKAAAALAQHGMEAWYPQEVVWRKTVRSRIEHQRPYIRGYVFALLDWDAEAWKLHDMEGISGTVHVPERAYAMLTAFLDEMRQAEGGGLFDHTLAEKRRKRLVEGTKVRVTGGMFSGMVGTLQRFEPQGRARVMLDLFGRSGPAQVQRDNLEAA